MGFHWNQCGARLSQSVWIFKTCCFPQPSPMEERGDPEFDETQHVYIPWKSGDNARHDHIEIWTRRSPFLSASRACMSTLVFFLVSIEKTKFIAVSKGVLITWVWAMWRDGGFPFCCFLFPFISHWKYRIISHVIKSTLPPLTCVCVYYFSILILFFNVLFIKK